MKKINILVVLITLVLIPVTAKSPREIVEKAMDLTDLQGVESLSQMILRDAKGNERIRETYMYSGEFNGVNKSVIKFLAPADIKGTAMLTWDRESEDDDMWLYLPALGKSRRIVSKEKAKTFMGSEFTYSDLSDPNLDDFTFKNLGLLKKTGNSNNPNPGTKEYIVIELIPKNSDLVKEYGFSKRDVFIDPDTGLISRAEYFDKKDNIERTMYILDIQLVEGSSKFRPLHLTVYNHKNKRSSDMIIKKIVINGNLKEDLFTTRYIEE